MQRVGRRLLLLLLVVLGLCVCAWPLRGIVRRGVVAVIQAAKGHHTVASRVAQYGDAVQQRLAPAFVAAKVAYPPRAITLIALKDERVLELWASDDGQVFRHIRSYPILAASGKLGPKLAEGDSQVPEGLYAVAALNPNSLFHLALRVDYPNADDRAQAASDGRSALGGDIMIHGGQASIGCLAMGDPAAEELFVLAAAVGVEQVRVLMCPVDLRHRPPPTQSTLPPWVPARYAQLQEALQPYGAAASQ